MTRTLTIAGIAHAPDGSGYYRFYLPFRWLAELSTHMVGMPPIGQQWRPSDAELAQIDVLAMQRPAGKAGVWQMEQLQGKAALVYETDDDMLQVDPSGLPHLYDERMRESIRRCIRLADMVTVSTAYLAEQVEPYNDNVVILPNHVNEELIPESERWQKELPEDRPLTIGWQGGTSHLMDMVTIQDPLRDVLDDNPKVQMHFAGFDYSPLLGRSCRWSMWKDNVWDHYRETSHFDIAIAPLADHPFNRSKCVDSSMRISTDRGVLEAGRLRPGMRVWRDGWRRIEAAEHSLPRPGLLVTLDGGYRLKLTPEHRMLAGDRWVQAKDLVVGSRLAMEEESVGQTRLCRVPWPADTRMSRAGLKGREDRFDPYAFLTAEDGPKLEITPRWGRLLGAFIGDGSVGQSTQMDISCDGQDADWIALLTDDLRACGFNPRSASVRTYDGTVLRKQFVRVASAHLIRVLESLGLAKLRPNGRAIRVTCIPEVIWQSPRDVIAEFLAAYFEADGHCTASGIKLVSKDEQLIRDVQRLLLTFGITSTVRSRVHSAQTGSAALYWSCDLRRAEADVFAKEIGFRSERKRARLAEIVGKPHSNAYRPMMWSREVTSIEPCMVTPVDIQVEGSVFVLAGFVSHNSHLKALEAAAMGQPIVCADLLPYRDFVVDGVTGFLVTTPEQWKARLNDLIHDADMRREMGTKAREVARNWTIQGSGWKLWEQAYQTVGG